MEMNLSVIIFAILCAFVTAEEHTSHGTPSKTFASDHSKNGHDSDLDHRAVLGSKKTAAEFDELSPDESKKRLEVLARRMDKDGDGYVTKEELSDWVHKSLLQLDEEETRERFEEIDRDKNNFITWNEYLQESFGTENVAEMDAEYAKLMSEDKIYFDAADRNGDGKLTEEEFGFFQNPEHYPHMHESLVRNTLAEKDTNKDGRIQLSEFLGDIHDQPQSEFFLTEKSRFTDEYDKDGDGFLADDELKAWLIPDLTQTARDEADHLFTSADANKDGKLSISEIVADYSTFVGSEATNFGEQLNSIKHEEL